MARYKQVAENKGGLRLSHPKRSVRQVKKPSAAAAAAAAAEPASAAATAAAAAAAKLVVWMCLLFV